MSEYEVFFINGTSKKSSLEEYLSYLYEDKDYQILVNNSESMNKFICYNDEVFNDVMLEAGYLFRFIEDFFITDDELDSYNLLYLMCQCGLDSDISFKNKNGYIELIDKEKHNAKYKFLYVSDILLYCTPLTKA